MNLFLLLMCILVSTTLGLAIAIAGLRNDLRLRRGTPYQQRRAALRAKARSARRA